MKKTIAALWGAFAFTCLATVTAKASDLDDALSKGAKQLSAEEITLWLADKTVTFENLNSGAKVLVYYDGQNGILLKPVGSDRTLKGFYATDLADHVCVGVYGDEPMRLRCVYVLSIDGIMHKYELNGALRGRIIEEVNGDAIS